MPAESEVFALTALMEIQASRIEARTGPNGEPILLLDQNRALWDQLLIRRGLAALARAEALAPTPGLYGLQAAIAACHARATESSLTDWARIASLYDALATLTGSPVVELNRAVAHAMVDGPQAGLDLVDALRDEAALKAYYLLPSVRGDFLVKLGRLGEAEVEFRRAAALTQNTREKSLLLARASACRQ
jgi:RNA polymerase sigma-70 factor (ECF subfamily)